MDAESEMDLQRINQALSVLSEHYDTVHIFCTRHENGTDEGTLSFQKGVGNWFARYGQVKEWVVKRDEEAREQTRPER